MKLIALGRLWAKFRKATTTKTTATTTAAFSLLCNANQERKKKYPIIRKCGIATSVSISVMNKSNSVLHYFCLSLSNLLLSVPSSSLAPALYKAKRSTESRSRSRSQPRKTATKAIE